MTLLYTDPRFRDHETGGHPECPARIEQVVGRLERGGLLARCERPDWRPVSDQRLLLCHDADYLAAVRALEAGEPHAGR